MTVRVGYLLPTRESIIEGRAKGERLLRLAHRAEQLPTIRLVGDSPLALDDNANTANQRINDCLSAYYGRVRTSRAAGPLEREVRQASVTH